jgi:murein DD-endopeptidase MepM/ murein hydrolase activator NlpD
VDPSQRALARLSAAACPAPLADAARQRAHRPFRRLALRSSAALAAGVVLLPPPAGAIAATPHGSAVPASPSAAAPPASPPSVAAAAVGRPVVDAVTCRTGCLGLATATAGSVVRVTGDGAESAASIVFLGRHGRGDDAVAAAHAVGPGEAEAPLPAGAHGGPVRLLTVDGRRSARSARRILVRSAARPGRAFEARVTTRKAYVDTTHRASLDVFVGGPAPEDVAVDLVRPADGAVLAHWALPAVPAATVQSVDWDGTAVGAAQPEGRYVFRVSVAAAGIRVAATGGGPARASSFMLLRNRFPILGPHRFGDSAGRFGAGRAGHVHQGQDTFADCGTPLVAAHGGTVKFAGFQSAAGNYLVVATDEGADHVYMHLRDPALVAAGAPVATGQPIGFVGDTGDAVGCHLHFELWPAPGWQSGGAPIDPLPSLTAWDAAS